MSSRFNSQAEIDNFLEKPRLAMLLYNGAGPAPTGVPVWFDWDGHTVRIFAGASSPKVAYLKKDPNVSVLVTNLMGEPEGWVAFDGAVTIGDYEPADWEALIDRMAPRYWDLSEEHYAETINQWRAVPQAFASLELIPEKIRSGG